MKENREIHVLVAEDNRLTNRMVTRILEQIGYTVIASVENGLQAFQATDSLRPDVVVMDVEMPVMNGIEAAKCIYERCPTSVVILTSYETEDLVKGACSAGVGAYLVKPPQAKELSRNIAIALARFDELMELRDSNARLREMLANSKVLRGLLPICASCKKIRNQDGYWQPVETYIEEHSEAQFTHGICPDCATRLYPEMYEQWSEDDLQGK